VRALKRQGFSKPDGKLKLMYHSISENRETTVDIRFFYGGKYSPFDKRKGAGCFLPGQCQRHG
jgi:hypothetical protein